MSFEAEIDQFCLEEEGEVQEEPTIQVSDTEDEPNRLSGVCTPSLVIAHIDNSSKEEEEEEMALNKKKGLRELLADKAKGLAPKDTPRSQPLPALPPSPLTVNLFTVANLKKKKKEKKVPMRERWSLKRSPSSRRRLKARGGPPLLKVKRPSILLTCAIQLETPDWSWMAQGSLRAPPSGSSKEVTPVTWLRL